MFLSVCRGGVVCLFLFGLRWRRIPGRRLCQSIAIVTVRGVFYSYVLRGKILGFSWVSGILLRLDQICFSRIVKTSCTKAS